MRVLINNNEHISQAAFAKHLFASGFDAEVTGYEIGELQSKLESREFDILALYAEEIDEGFLLRLFKSAGKMQKVLLLKRHLLEEVGQELESRTDEIFTIPLSFSDFSIRFRRLLRARPEDGKEETLPLVLDEDEDTQPDSENSEPEEFAAIDITDEADAEAELETADGSDGEGLTDSQPLNEVEEEEGQAEADNELEDYLLSTFEGENEEKADVSEELESPPATEERDEAAEVGRPEETNQTEPQPLLRQEEQKIYSTQSDLNAGKGKKGKRKTPLRYLNKTDLLEIILEQERIINEQRAKAQKIEEELAKREIVLGQSGSIAEAATKISGIFEAAQDAADRYLESVIAVNGGEKTEATEE